MNFAMAPHRDSRPAAELAIAGVLALAAVLVRFALDPFLSDKHQYVPALAAIAAVGWLSGWRSAALTAFACLVGWEFFPPISPSDAIGSHVALAWAGYLVSATCVIWGAEWLRRQDEQAHAAAAELREADRRKSDFIGLLGHELRNPLAAIAMAGKVLKSGALDAAAARHTVDIVERQAEHMNRLVGDLLDATRMRNGKLSLHRERIDVLVAVQDVIRAVLPATQARRQRVILLQRRGAGFISADPVRLHQMLANLLGNASKFSPERTDISIVVEGRDDAVEVRVEDAGIGIEPAQLERIFEPFVQVEPQQGEGRGLGLGLPLTRELAQLHGGSVHAFSAGKGCGSTFALTLPRGLPPGERPVASAAIGAPASGTATSPPDDDQPARRVLVVDDNPDAAETLALLLQIDGHETFTAPDGKVALELASREHPDLVFLDIGLPDMSGLEVATRLRRLLGPRPTLVALTGWGSDEDQRRSRAAGCDAHLVKPVEPAALAHAFAIAREPARAAGGTSRPTSEGARS